MASIGSRGFWIPGRRQAALFPLLVLLGLGAWAFWVPFLGEGYHTGTILYALPALGAGLVSPRGFYLWGVAVVLAHPWAGLALEAAFRQSRGADAIPGGEMEWVGLAFVLVLMSFTMAMVATVLSGLGAGLRLLWDHLRGGRAVTPRGIRSQ